MVVDGVAGLAYWTLLARGSTFAPSVLYRSLLIPHMSIELLMSIWHTSGYDEQSV